MFNSIGHNYPIGEIKVIKNNTMREYKYKAITDGSDFEDYVIKLNNIDTKEQLKEYLNVYYDDSVYWAKEVNGDIFYSRDEIYNTEQQDATHLVIFMK